MQAGGLASGQFDVLHVTGNATLGGTLEMTFLNGYLPRSGDTFRFLEVDGSITGQFAQVVFPQLLPGFQFDTVVVPGGLQFTALNDAILKHRALEHLDPHARGDGRQRAHWGLHPDRERPQESDPDAPSVPRWREQV